MTKNIDQLNLRELEILESHIPLLAGFPQRILANTYEKFVHALYITIDKIIYGIEENPELTLNDSEDRITVEIKRGLRLIGYEASHDQKVGGHTDLLVRYSEFLWIGEAKFDNSLGYIFEGWLQLNSRYSTGGSNQGGGGILIYIRREKAAKLMEDWKQYLSRKGIENLAIAPCPNRSMTFMSCHPHERSGLPFSIRHMPIMLHFKPKDKSGRGKKTA